MQAPPSMCIGCLDFFAVVSIFPSLLTVAELEQQLKQIIANVKSQAAQQPPIGIFTTEHRDVWTEVYQKLSAV